MIDPGLDRPFLFLLLPQTKDSTPLWPLDTCLLVTASSPVLILPV